MIEGASWRRWVFFYVPVTAFVVTLLFPFYWMVITTLRPDKELYRPWNAPNYTPFWTTNPTLEHIQRPADRDAVQHLDAEHDADLDRGDG